MVITYLEIVGEALAIVAFTLLVYFLFKKTKLGTLGKWKQQIIVGVAFGLLSFLATEFNVAVPEGSAAANVRDACFVVPALVFGGPSGVIAAIIGGTYRGLSTLWHPATASTWLACTIAAFGAGLVAAFFRHFLFDEKRPAFYFGLIISLVTETFHMLLIFLTNIGNVKTAFTIVSNIGFPVFIGNAIAVSFALLAISLINKEFRFGKKNETKREIAKSFSGWLSITVVIAFVLTTACNVVIQMGLASYSAQNDISINLDDVTNDVNDASDKNLLKITRVATDQLNNWSGDYSNAVLEYTVNTSLPAAGYSVSDMVYIDINGIIRSSYLKSPIEDENGVLTHNPFYGYDMASGEQSGAFMVLLDKWWLEQNPSCQFVQSYGPISYDNTKYRKYAGETLFDAAGNINGFIQVGYDSESFQADIAEQVDDVTKNRLIGESGSIIIANERFEIKSQRKGQTGITLSSIGFTGDALANTFQSVNSSGIHDNQSKTFRGTVYDVDCLYQFRFVEGYYIVGVLPYSEAYYTAQVSIYILFFMEIILFAFIFACVYFLTKRLVVSKIHNINASLGEITKGNLNVVVKERSNEEFASLSDDINSTVETLKRYIAEASARIDKELEFARAIQLSSLPSIWPAFPERPDFSIYALMAPAKEVGGDFYDFYLLDENHLAFLVADVSGKGIPAALFMMRAKALIKGYVTEGLHLDEAFMSANVALCENNDAELFVTSWMGIWNKKKGTLSFVNAGQNPPLIRRQNGDYEFLKSKSNFVLGGLPKAKYSINEIPFVEGDSIFLYTDGVSEATSKETELYGDDRLLKAINLNKELGPEALIKALKKEVDLFQSGAPQFDDITMVSVVTSPKPLVHEVKNPTVTNITEIESFIESSLEGKIDDLILSKINIAVDEIVSNIAQYSGATHEKIEVYINPSAISLIFKDDGTPYDPTGRGDPDVSSDVNERKIGGLGIYIVKKSMDYVSYHYQNNHNVLTVVKALPIK